MRAEDAFTLVEAVIAAAVLAVGLTSLLGLLDTSVKATAATRTREAATNLARQILEDARSIPYAQMSPGAVVGELQAMTGLANEGSGSWQIARRGTTFTVIVNECAIDDPKDGLGRHVNGLGENPFCAGEQESTGKEANEDPTPEDFKRVSVDVKWSALGRSPHVRQAEILTAAGEAPGLSAGALHLQTPLPSPPSTAAQPTISVEPASEALTFAVTSPAGTKAMRWSLQGVVQSPDPTLKSGTEWTFSWPIPLSTVSDGTYVISAQAIDATGVEGPPVSITVMLIRTVPGAVKGLKGGFNEVYRSGVKTRVVELEWHANTERNVIGYRIYNPSNPGELVCPESETTLSTALSCVDFEKLPSPSSSNLTYTAVALYRNASGAVSQGTPASFNIIGGPPPAPNAPQSPVKAEKTAEGSVILHWEAPKAGGESVAFYRIYRDSTDYTSRYGVSTSTTFTDTDAVTTHSYWVTAVDANLTESSLLVLGTA